MSSEVGSGHVAIVPRMLGFKAAVSKETRAAGTAGAKTFGTGFKGAGRAAGREVGADMKRALTQSAGDMGGDVLRKLAGNVASASAALSKARLKQQDEAGKVRVAETRLQEALKKSGEGSSQAVAAEERLASVRRSQQTAADAVAAATTRLKGAQDALTEANRSSLPIIRQTSGGLLQMSRDFRAGFSNANAATSAFTGVSASIGGILRAASDASGLTAIGRFARLGAAQASRAFTSLATMVGGKLASAWSVAARGASSVGSAVARGLAPVGRAATTAGRVLATPFVQLGTKVSSWLSPVATQVQGLFTKLGPIAGRGASTFVSTFSRGVQGLGSAASSAFSSLASAASNAGARAGQALGSALKGTSTAAVTVVAAGLGTAFTKGVGRLTAIDTAQAKLRGLGNDVKAVDQIMADASASVKGTAFGLGDAATVAASAVAAQIKPGEELETHLKRIANNAAAAGVGMSEMGSIFNKAATQANGVQNDVIGQLADKGIPIYQALADQMGVTAGEVFKMASEGKVDFETFSKAAEKAAGTVAKEMGTTVPGAASNFFAALGRIGANALGGLYGKVAPLIQAATSALGPIEEKAKVFGDILLKTVGPAIDWTTNLLNQLGAGSGDLVSKLSGIAPVLAPLAGAFAALGAGGLAGLLTRLPLIGPMLGGLAGPLKLLGGPLGIAAAALAAFYATGGDTDAFVSGITGMVDQIVQALPGVIDAVVQAVPGIVDGILSAIPQLLSAATQIVDALIAGIIVAVPLLVDGAVSLIDGLVSALIANLPAIIDGAITLVGALLTGIVKALPLIIQGALTLVTSLLSGIVALLPTIIEGGVKLLMALIQGIIEALPLIIDAALQLVTGLLTAIVENLPLIIDAGIQLLLSLVTGLLGALPELIVAAVDLVLQLVQGLIENLPLLIEAGVQMIISLIAGLVEAIPQIIAMLPDIFTAIWDGLAEMDWASIGQNIIDGLIGGIKDMASDLGGVIKDLASQAWDGFTDFFGIHSPSRLMRGAGVNLVEGAELGVDDKATSFSDSLVSMAKKAGKKAQTSLSGVSVDVVEGVTTSRAGRPPGDPGDPSARPTSGGGSAAVHIEANFAEMDPDVAIEALGQRVESVARRVGV